MSTPGLLPRTSLAILCLVWGSACTRESAVAQRQADPPVGESSLTFSPPRLDAAPEPIRGAVKRGFDIVHRTREAAPDHTGNQLDCTNCHFDAGMVKDTLSLVGVSAVFPQVREENGQLTDLAQMTDMCFTHFLNAPPLSAHSADMLAVLTYYQWISKGIPVYAEVPWLGLEPLHSSHTPSAQAGMTLYAEICSACHGGGGEGTSIAPPVWGDGSWPRHTGFMKVDVLGAFVHRFMPKGNPYLSVDQSLDAAAFVISQPRPALRGGSDGG